MSCPTTSTSSSAPAAAASPPPPLLLMPSRAASCAAAWRTSSSDPTATTPPRRTSMAAASGTWPPCGHVASRRGVKTWRQRGGTWRGTGADPSPGAGTARGSSQAGRGTGFTSVALRISPVTQYQQALTRPQPPRRRDQQLRAPPATTPG